METQVLGYYSYPEHKGKAVFDRISRSFVHSEAGSHDVISGEAGEVVHFVRYVKIPYLESKRGRRVWQFDDSDAVKILQAAQETHLRAEDSRRVQGIVSSIQAVLSDIEEKEDFVSPDISQEYEGLSPWLRDRLDSCEVGELPVSRGLIRRLIALAQEKKNPDHYLQAAKLQTQDGDYKFVITLANYCLDVGYKALNERHWRDAFDSFLEAARLYQRDPMITEAGWKHDQRLRSLRLAIQAATSGVLDSHKYSLSHTICLDAVEREVATPLQRQLPIHKIREFIRESYYIQMATHLLDIGQQSDFLQFYEDAPDQTVFPQWMELRYYREKSRESEKKAQARSEDFFHAAEYRKMAANLLSESEGDENIGYREEMVDYHKCLALAHLLSGEVANFDSHIDDAIQFAEQLKEDPQATGLHHENSYFLGGVKYGGLARYETDPDTAAEYYFRASQAYGQVHSTVAQGRSTFHQLMGYQSRVRAKLGKAPEDFAEAASVCREALAELWGKGRIEVLRKTDLLTYRALFESLCLLTTEHLSPERWYQASRLHERIQAENLDESARWIWNLAYGTRLIEGGGVTLGEVTSHLRAVVRSAICQLLERKAISETEMYDDLVAIQLADGQLERRKHILSLLRQQRLSTEGLEVECKEFFYDPNCTQNRVISSLHEAAIFFLNSPKGGQIIIGVEDGTFEVRGIEKDLQRLDGSEARLKDAVLDHIRNMVQEGLPLPSITISIERVEGDEKVIYIDVPPGDYQGSLYKNNKGIAFIRMDGSKRTVKSVLEQDELAQQRRLKWSRD